MKWIANIDCDLNAHDYKKYASDPNYTFGDPVASIWTSEKLKQMNIIGVYKVNSEFATEYKATFDDSNHNCGNPNCKYQGSFNCRN